jgi:hypothetical protein
MEPCMNVRFAAACLLLPLVAACGGVDATQLTGRHNVVGTTDPTAPGDGTAAADPAADGGVDPASAPGTDSLADGGDVADGAADAGPDGATVTPPAPVTAFTGAGAFVSQLGPSTRKSSHNFAGNNPPTSPMGQACSNCHNFFAGGTVYADAAGTMPAPGVEVRARNAAGVAVSAWTDQDGNFYMPTSGGVTLPASIGVRNAAATKAMSSSIATGTCASSSCHVAGKQGPIHLP